MRNTVRTPAKEIAVIFIAEKASYYFDKSVSS